jgi:hypothetical protein
MCRMLGITLLDFILSVSIADEDDIVVDVNWHTNA